MAILYTVIPYMSSGFSKYFIKNKNKNPRKWDRTVPEVSRECPPLESGEQ
jgi:hypothetical protein